MPRAKAGFNPGHAAVDERPMTAPESFFVFDGSQFVATEFTRGPWDPGLQHGGPPSALLARAFESLAGPMCVVRLSIELVRPVPIAPLIVRAETSRAGKKAMWLSGSITCCGKEVLRATATAIRSTTLVLPAHPSPNATMPPPEASTPFSFPFFTSTLGYQTAVELRLSRGPWGSGACAAWMRPRVPLVLGETMSPLQRTVVCADAGNGVSMMFPPHQITVLNPDLTIHLHRLPAGEWIGLDAKTSPEESGIGLSESYVHDASGPCGRSLQTLVIEQREP